MLENLTEQFSVQENTARIQKQPLSRDSLYNLIGRQLIHGDQKINVSTVQELDILVRFAVANKALARILPAIAESSDVQITDEVSKLRSEQASRLREAMALLKETQAICLELNVPFLVMKSFDALPDLGHDIDLLVGVNLPSVRKELLRRLQCYPVTLTFCDRQAGKFSTFIKGYTFDFELYAGISQLGEQYVSSQQLLAHRKLEQIHDSQTYLCSYEDRFLITCIHTMYRHGKLRLSDVNLALECFRKGIDANKILENVQAAGIQAGLSLFVAILQTAARELTGTNSLVPSQISEYSKNILRKDRLLNYASSTIMQRKDSYPLKLPLWTCTFLFLRKAFVDFSGHKFSSSMRSFVAPIILFIDKAIPLRLQKAISVRIW